MKLRAKKAKEKIRGLMIDDSVFSNAKMFHNSLFSHKDFA